MQVMPGQEVVPVAPLPSRKDPMLPLRWCAFSMNTRGSKDFQLVYMNTGTQGLERAGEWRRISALLRGCESFLTVDTHCSHSAWGVGEERQYLHPRSLESPCH